MPRTGLSSPHAPWLDLGSILGVEPRCGASDEQHGLWKKIDQTQQLMMPKSTHKHKAEHLSCWGSCLRSYLQRQLVRCVGCTPSIKMTARDKLQRALGPRKTTSST
ncbi:hypothetical protein AV530_007313 [Patagioenas fasciata monilis]|uniref:Uncharacterized protein n=1 Tax=Patagioenas fasciata monilis TaxID=372326 RepID=A0A1V4JX99_PATFA|nr:hypothetical protein AV530_007313 [Patagioenas fasciata monilis]